ncbi:putative monocarboxylate transporter 2 isoform X2 [Apostichopus japonicus]|uniref:Putative monocarboxylate transporter 2 isoform X2 n=1 Tax=Stichopus japonicus TaxID=307972 RepID=A0A2G8JB82_STIJA|nr:putative monocarboxylate transporter 2 isoform X2 [Apostichopus japonicus]
MVMKLPELWFISIALMGCAMTMSFYYVSLGNFMKILGFTGTQRSLTISIIAVSEIIGKILLSLFGDHLPFGKIYLFVISSVLGIGIMLSLLFLVRDFPSMILLSIVTGCIVMTVFDALPYSICNQVFGKKRRVEAWTVILCANGIGLILGSLFGESVDKTGSYDDALYLSIIIYCVAFVLYLLVPFYQKCFTKRFIMAKEKKRKITLADEWGVGGPHPNLDRRESFSPSPLTNETRVERESCV